MIASICADYKCAAQVLPDKGGWVFGGRSGEHSDRGFLEVSARTRPHSAGDHEGDASHFQPRRQQPRLVSRSGNFRGLDGLLFGTIQVDQNKLLAMPEASMPSYLSEAASIGDERERLVRVGDQRRRPCRTCLPAYVRWRAAPRRMGKRAGPRFEINSSLRDGGSRVVAQTDQTRTETC